MAKTLFIVNANAGNGRGQRTWEELEPLVHRWSSEHSVVMTRFADDVADCVAQAATNGTERVISIGGDGTNNIVVNALMNYNRNHPKHSLIYGSIPAGTGRDFARGTRIPLDTLKAAQHILGDARPRPVDVGYVIYNDVGRYFLNISSAGISRDVVDRVEKGAKRPWTYLMSVIASLTKYQPEGIRIEIDNQPWFEGRIYIAAVANGRFFGQGIMIAPDAVLDDGLFDVVIAEEMPTLELIKAFPSLYTGKHIHHHKVKLTRGKQVRIYSQSEAGIGMDFDGEPATASRIISYDILPNALMMLL